MGSGWGIRASYFGYGCKIKEIEGTLTGRVKFIFQPAEELGHGAFKIIETPGSFKQLTLPNIHPL
ncbi:hypothetical protein GF516_14215 [Staphylococcus aureus]|nr:hypothetical protein [Staphylococcus aureus]